MSLPNAGKVSIKTPQNVAGAPAISKAKSGAGSSPTTIKTVIQNGSKASQTKEVGPRGYGSAAKPDKAGTKISKVIQTSTSASTTKK